MSLSPRQFGSLRDVASAGYNTDEWSSWQQGRCGTYACGLQRIRPDLRIGTLDQGSHFFAHDDTHAYDSAGRHPLPYRGIAGDAEQVDLDQQPDWWGVPHDEAGSEGPEPHVHAAMQHAERHGILHGRYGAHKSFTAGFTSG
jgi:hypothetical protein